MTFKRASVITGIVLLFHGIGLLFHLYWVFPWYDIPLHFGGGLAMGAFGIALWHQGIEHVTFKTMLERHLSPWLVPLFVIGFVALIGVLWEMHEFLLDVAIGGVARQADVADTMADLFNDIAGGLLALLLFHDDR